MSRYDTDPSSHYSYSGSMSPVLVPRKDQTDNLDRNDGDRSRSRHRLSRHPRKRDESDSRSPYRKRSRSTSPYRGHRAPRRGLSYSRSPKRWRPLPRSRSPESRKHCEDHHRPRRRLSRSLSPRPRESHGKSIRGDHLNRRPSSLSPRRRHSRSRSRSPKNHKRSRRRPTLSASPPPQSKRSTRPLPSQNDAYKGTSTHPINPSEISTETTVEKQKPNYAPTGLLAAETNTVAHTSIVLKYHEPPESRLPPSSQPYLLYIFKSSTLLQKITLNERSCWLFGREAMVADIPVEHPSASKQHAVLQFRHVVKKDEFGEKKGGVGLYVLDLDSANGTFLNVERVEGRRFVEVRGGDVLRWGESSREYVLLVPPKEMV